MKFLKVKIIRNTNANEPTMQYPVTYNAAEVEGDIKGRIIYDGGLSRGEDTEECLILVSDDLATIYSKDKDMEVLTKAQANTWLASNDGLKDQPNEQVTDINRLTAIIAKKSAGVELSQEDLDALDPTKDVLGINTTPKTVDTIWSKVSGLTVMP